jgi:uncharacterized protein
MKAHSTKLIALAAAAFAVAATSSTASAASFNCYGRLNVTEATICANPQLSTLDSRMANAYFRATGASSPALRKRLQREQAAWLRYRNGCGGGVGCLQSVYVSRINEMSYWGD